MDQFERFCQIYPFDATTKAEQATAFLWFHIRAKAVEEAELKTIASYFDEASLPKPGISRLRDYFIRHRNVHRGSRKSTFRLTRSAFEELDQEYGHIFEPEEELSVTVKANVRQTPYLTESHVDAAFEMAQLYVVLHCYENSVRRVIEQVLSEKLGDSWWENAANSRMQQKVATRKQTESKNRWLSSRGSSPLYYIDWGDLTALMRKYEAEFLPLIGDVKFVELRFEELERLRNIVAHHGCLPATEDYQRVVISFRDWCLQVKP